MRRRVDEAVAEVKRQAEADTDEQLTDLLVCLGQVRRRADVRVSLSAACCVLLLSRAMTAFAAPEASLPCLACGCAQEEQKVALLRERLAAYGVDVEALLATIKPDDEEGEPGAGEDDDGLQ